MELLCPDCGTDTLKRYRPPRVVGGVVFRRHICEQCSRVTTSAQMLLINDDMIEEAMELALRGQDTPAAVALADAIAL